jgi:DNA polymerase-3 subunit gamma/tau
MSISVDANNDSARAGGRVYYQTMSYVVFARKYRPQTFDDVVAQEHVTRTLRNALANDRIASGYLFCGPRGTGKTTVARILAKAVNCINGPTPTPCGECPACVEITAGSSLDVLEVDAASNTGVDDIRTLRENVRYLPTRGKRRIYIIDEVHRLSGSAFDALLKTLEEPPPHVMFIFATTEPLKVPETILSRTQRFDFRRVSAADLVAHLRNIAKQENLQIEERALTIIARKAEGGVRDALSLLDQIAAFCGDKITEPDVVNALRLVDRQMLVEFVDAVAASDRTRTLTVVRRVIDSGVDPADFVAELIEHLRTLMILRSTPTAENLVQLSSSEFAEYKVQAEYFALGDLLRLLRMAGEVNADLKSGLDHRLVLDVAAVRMAELESTIRLEEVIAFISERGALPPGPGAGTGEPNLFAGSAQKKNDSFQPSRPVNAPPPPEPSAPLRTVNLAQIKAGWENYLIHLRSQSQMLASQMKMAELRGMQDNQIQLVFLKSGDVSRQLVGKPDNLNLILRTLREHFKTNLAVRFEVDVEKDYARPEPTELSVSQADARRLVDNSPRLKKLMEMVDGEIIGVKQHDSGSKQPETKEQIDG